MSGRDDEVRAGEGRLEGGRTGGGLSGQGLPGAGRSGAGRSSYDHASDGRASDGRPSDDRSSEGRNKPLYMISVAAELTGMHPQTLRVYEQKGLVNPGRSRGNTRLYSQADIDRLALIGRLTDEGINLAGVVRILDMREHEEEMESEIDELRARVRQLEDQVREYKTRERITALAKYDGGTPESVMRGLLGGGVSGEGSGAARG